MPNTNVTVKLLGISGSLRRASFNTALLEAARGLAPEGVSIEVASIREIQLYDEDVRSVGYPAPVQAFREAIAAADGVLFVTPEYNYSVPGVLKNAIDWASRPPSQPFAGKPIAIMGASGGMSGTMRAQYHLRQVMVGLDAHAVNKPEIFVRQAPSLLDESGKLTDEPTRKLVRELVAALAAAAREVKAAKAAKAND